ncbi:tRNA (adenosine(37)-N6)-dimethylallyltransferase MiaA [Flexithrix dorotheae]|uniref:tRNA (adenosine(37)-N6)-dimethylallyltransferase MiaA n=1 Tax=Flexithrix dorotheae TaxID=70993 RepID=UPI00037F33BA|nr:tRNA (adenosine(37)-N6)-dimethylallyltransferase MiaA [Flexithrix dorotheae]
MEPSNDHHPLIIILGPTASGKTSLASHLAYNSDSEIISADSRQVYQQMDIGTGKDLDEYIVNGQNIPYHLIDIKPPGYRYNIHEFKADFDSAYSQIRAKGKLPILCGGSGLYIEAVLKGHEHTQVPENENLRKELSQFENKNLLETLANLPNPNQIKIDTSTRKRLIRGIEILTFLKENHLNKNPGKNYNSIIFGLNPEREKRRNKITKRLKYRLENGLIEEVKNLLESGISPEDLKYYGLEYKLVTEFLEGKLNQQTLFEKLNTSIHQFAKRQMTWFRKMEKDGFEIIWVNDELTFEEKIDFLLKKLNQFRLI